MITLYLHFLLNLVWTQQLCAAFVVRVSERGSDTSSCWGSNAALPCKSIGYAMKSIWDPKNVNETVFTYLIDDEVYSLEERVKIIQTNAGRSVHLKSRNRSVMNCKNASVGIDVGTHEGKDTNHANKTRNIVFENLEFKNCGPDLAAVVRIWNSVDIKFTNCVFRHNNQSGINSFDSAVTIEYCRFTNNTPNANTSPGQNYTAGVSSIGGGAGFMFENATNLSLKIRHSIFEFNSAGGHHRMYVLPTFRIPDKLRGYFGGGIFVAFIGKSQHCQVEIFNTTFSNNAATSGGGIFLEQSDKVLKNKYNITSSNFKSNFASEVGGGLVFSDDTEASSSTCVFKNCVVSENISKRTSGILVALTNFRSTNVSTLRFDTMTFSNNHGSKGSVIFLASNLPYNRTNVTPEFINCTIKDHKIPDRARSRSLTSLRVNLKFLGTNFFHQNHGGGAAAFHNCVVFVHGKLAFTNNSGTSGGALFMGESQIKLFPGSEVVFLGNKASGPGGAIFAHKQVEAHYVLANNPFCFLAYSDPFLPPSKWETNVSFIENSSKVRGAAVYISSVQSCAWHKELPHHYGPKKALRWSNNFVYQNNFLISGEIRTGLNGSENDIASNPSSYWSNTKNGSLELMPGENYPLILQALDELEQDTLAFVTISEIEQVNDTSSILLDNNAYMLSSNKTIPFSFQVPEETYTEIENKNAKVKRNLLFVDPFSVLTNSHFLQLEVKPCRPGFIFSRDLKRCVCNTTLEAIQRCDSRSAVYLKEGYWANISDAGDLVTYFCPFKYCKCTPKDGLPGCLFDPERIDDQCAKNREGWMCGKCKENTSVGLRLRECIECEKSGLMLGLVIPLAIGLCVFTIWLNPGISSELRGPLYFFQVLPFIFDPTDQLGEQVFLATDIFSFRGPFSHLFKTCAYQGITTLHALTLDYTLPGLVFSVFLLAYFLSAKYYLKFKFRRRSMLPSFWILLLFVYNVLARTSFLILFCPNVGEKHVFFYDGTITCFQGNHLPMATLAIVVLVFIVIPLPIIVVVVTLGFWRVDPQFVDTLTISLRRKFRWWWSVDLARRVLVAAIFTCVPNWKIKKILMMVVCNVILVVHSNCQPYTRWRANITESLYLLVLSMLALIEIVQETVEFKSTCEIISFVLLGMMSTHTVVVFVYKAVIFCRSTFKCCARTQDPLERSGYQQIEISSTDQSFDAEIEERRNIFKTIYRTQSKHS